MGVTAPGPGGAPPAACTSLIFRGSCLAFLPLGGAKTRPLAPGAPLPPHLSSGGCAGLCQGLGIFLPRRTEPPSRAPRPPPAGLVVPAGPAPGAGRLVLAFQRGQTETGAR